MNNGADLYELHLEIDGADEEERDQSRRKLQRELNELEGVTRIEQLSAGKIPEGARAVDLVTVGALALTLKEAGVFDAVAAVLKTWIESGNRRKEKRKVVVKRPDGTTLEFDGYELKFDFGQFQVK